MLPPSSPRNGAILITAPILCGLVLSGCITKPLPGGDGSKDPPVPPNLREAALGALESLWRGFSLQGNVSKVTGNYTVVASDGFQVEGTFQGTMGRNGTLKGRGTARSTTTVVHCNATRITVRVFGGFAGGRVVEERQRGGIDACMEKMHLRSFRDWINVTEDTRVVSAGNSTSGRLRAAFAKVNKTGTLIRVEASISSGAVTDLTLKAKDERSQMHIEASFDHRPRHPRSNVSFPSVDWRKAAFVRAEEHEEETGYMWTGRSTGRYPLQEFEVRIYNGTVESYCESIANTVAVSFNFSRPSQSINGFSFRFQNNGDQLLGEGDTFTITYPDGANSDSYEVVVWDRWADSPISAQCVVPFPGFSSVVWVLVAVPMVWRRRD